MGKSVTNVLNQHLADQDIIVHIVGLSGNIDTGVNGEQEKVGVCRLYGFEKFAIEKFKWLSQTDSRLAQFRDKQFDLVVSRSTFQHFIDPIGTFLDIYRSVAPSGFFVGDILHWHVAYIGECLDGALYGHHNGCVGHGRALIALGSDSPVKLPIDYVQEQTEDGQKYRFSHEVNFNIEAFKLKGDRSKALAIRLLKDRLFPDLVFPGRFQGLINRCYQALETPETNLDESRIWFSQDERDSLPSFGVDQERLSRAKVLAQSLFNKFCIGYHWFLGLDLDPQKGEE